MSTCSTNASIVARSIRMLGRSGGGGGGAAVTLVADTAGLTTGRVSNATRLMSSRCHGEMLSEVMFPPQEPQPSVMLGERSVDNPIDPCGAGVFTTIREAG